MNKKKLLRLSILTALIGFGFSGEVLAAEQSTDNDEPYKYTLPETIITAQRIEKSDIDTPATTTVITAEDLERAGYRNVFEAIDQQLGSTSTSYGDVGQEFGFSAGRITLRGYDRGTLVMVNGVPLNLKNYPSAENIPANMVERIEIVKGAGSTLYGSEAMGGVVNIILKKPVEDSFRLSTTVGNYFKKTEAVFESDGILVDVSREWSGDRPKSNAFGLNKVSWRDWKVGKGQKNRVGIIATINDELSLSYNYTDATITRSSILYKKSTDGKSLVPTTSVSDNRFDDLRHTASLAYRGRDNGIKVVAGYNYRKVNGTNNVTKKKLDSNTILDSEILDVQKNWNLGDDTMVLGYSYKREAADLTERKKQAVRNSHSLYVSYGKQFDDRLNLTLGLRGELIDDPKKDQQVIMPQVQLNYKLNPDTAWYINAGKAFQMPAVDDAILYNNINVNGLKPEEGWNYETGIKLKRGSEIWKLAIYHMDFKNKIGWAKDALGQNYAVNKGNFRNTGIELEYHKRFNEVWGLTLGGSIANPRVQDPSTATKLWEQDAGRLEGLVSIDYQKAKWQGNLNLKYLGDREYYKPSSGTAQDIPSKMQLNMNITYLAGKNDTLTLGIYNLLDRENYSNRFGNLDLPLNFRLSYTHAF